eukprot:Platyproteum_vivax@DN16514_c0_g1_i1.p1
MQAIAAEIRRLKKSTARKESLTTQIEDQIRALTIENNALKNGTESLAQKWRREESEKEEQKRFQKAELEHIRLLELLEEKKQKEHLAFIRSANKPKPRNYKLEGLCSKVCI